MRTDGNDNFIRERGEAYDRRFQARAAAGQDVHGEANFVESLKPRSVLDAGCGTGRVAIELTRRGIQAAGVDIDPEMIDVARHKAPDLDWRIGDLAEVRLGRTFDLVVMAGNVMLFVARGSEGKVVRNLSRHLDPRGLLVAGFQLDFSLDPTAYDALAAEAGLSLVQRWATWDREPWQPGGSYAVSVHRKDSSTAV
jgi:SAM-dependent methyltransferase